MKKSIPGYKDDNGIFSKAPTPPVPPVSLIEVDESEVSLDDIARRIVSALNRATKHLLEQITAGDVSREVIGALKDCEAMHRELAKKEKEFLDNASDEQLQKMVSDRAK